MTLGNMRKQGVRGLAVYCLNHVCRHHTVMNVDDWPHEVEVPYEVQQVWRPARGRAAELERGEPGDRLARAAGDAERGLRPCPEAEFKESQLPH